MASPINVQIQDIFIHILLLKLSLNVSKNVTIMINTSSRNWKINHRIQNVCASNAFEGVFKKSAAQLLHGALLPSAIWPLRLVTVSSMIPEHLLPENACP